MKHSSISRRSFLAGASTVALGAAPQKNWPWAAAYYSPLFYAVNPETFDFVSTGPTYQNTMPGLAVNKEGKRFMNEDISCCMSYSPLMKQPDMTGFTIWTKNFATELEPWCLFGQYYQDMSVNQYTGEEMIAKWDQYAGFEGVGETPLESNRFDSLDELAKHFDLPLETLKETIATYNEKCAQGYDDEFGKRAGRLIPIEEEGPYYAMKYTPALMSMFGGPRCDVNARVLDENDEVIEGLHEVGSMMGDIYQSRYSFLYTGANMGYFCFTYGYLTGKALAQGEI